MGLFVLKENYDSLYLTESNLNECNLLIESGIMLTESTDNLSDPLKIVSDINNKLNQETKEWNKKVKDRQDNEKWMKDNKPKLLSDILTKLRAWSEKVQRLYKEADPSKRSILMKLKNKIAALIIRFTKLFQSEETYQKNKKWNYKKRYDNYGKISDSHTKLSDELYGKPEDSIYR